MRKIVVILLLLLVATACTKRIYVPVETTHTEYVVQHTRDTLTRSDSVYVHEYTKGDTVFIDKIKWFTEYKVRIVSDTVHVTDSVPKPYPVEVVKEVEKPLTWWQRFRLNAFGWLLGAVGIAGVWIFRRRIFR